MEIDGNGWKFWVGEGEVVKVSAIETEPLKRF